MPSTPIYLKKLEKPKLIEDLNSKNYKVIFYTSDKEIFQNNLKGFKIIEKQIFLNYKLNTDNFRTLFYNKYSISTIEILFYNSKGEEINKIRHNIKYNHYNLNCDSEFDIDLFITIVYDIMN